MPKKGIGKLGKARSNPCPTCKVKVGDYCVSKSGKPTPTSIHRARLALAAKPNFRLEGSFKAKWDHSKAGRKAWKTRLARQRAKVDAAFEAASTYVSLTPTPITLGELCQKAIDFTSSTITSVMLSVQGVGTVHSKLDTQGCGDALVLTVVKHNKQ